MDWLTGLPWIGPRIARFLRTHAWRAFAHLQSVHWTRLAAAMTFTSFLSLFPLLAVVAAVGAALLSKSQLDTLQNKISEQIPGIADQLNISGLVDNAGTIGLIAGATLLFTGMGWVASLRDCLRAVWRKDDEPHNPFKAKAIDGGILIGLGVAVLVSLGASGFATAAANWAVEHAGLDDHGPGRLLFTVIGLVLAVGADFLILTYLLTVMPGVEPPRRSVVLAALIGAIGFELLKLLLSGYLQKVAGKNMYGAFGTPVALLLWINFMAKLLLYCSAWTATPVHAEDGPADPAEPQADADGGEPGGPEQDPERDPEADPLSKPAPGGATRAASDPPAGNPNRDGTTAAHGPANETARPARQKIPMDPSRPGSEADGGAARR